MSYIENIRTFVRVYELGSMSAAGRDLRISPAVTSSRISQLEDYLNVRLFQRTTRSLGPTEQGRAFYTGALKVLEAIEDAEANVSAITENPKGLLHVAAPLGVGRRLIAPLVPEFSKEYPLIDVRLRLSDRKVDLAVEGLDVAFFLGQPKDSEMRIRLIANCQRVLCASPSYIAKYGTPKSGEDLEKGHQCLNLRFPGATEFHWQLQTDAGPKTFRVSGRFESDDGDVLTDWALSGQGIVMKPLFEVAEYLKSGALQIVAKDTPPVSIQMACLYTHRRHQDPKTRYFIEYMGKRLGAGIREAEQSVS